MEKIAEKILIDTKLAEIISVRELTSSTYVLRFSRNNLEFKAGQYIVIGPEESKQKREYSIYSPETSPYLEVLIKEVDNGYVSQKLKRSKPGDIIEVEGPFGHFILNEKKIAGRKFLFIASGTGISPFHSMVKSNSQINYQLLHGVRSLEEGYDRTEYEAGNYIQCTSKDTRGEFNGRVTEYLVKNRVDPTTYCYLCGNGVMIDEVYAILEMQGVPSENIFTEIYF
jgi:ferredoxin--NADP+ reductase/benzoate/toluate 1,2-dioxygenase reductase subunit